MSTDEPLGSIEEEFNRWLIRSRYSVLKDQVFIEEIKHVYYAGAFASFLIVDESLLNGKPDQFRKLHEDVRAYFRKRNPEWVQ